jgi:hypothetical protein
MQFLHSMTYKLKNSMIYFLQISLFESLEICMLEFALCWHLLESNVWSQLTHFQSRKG